MLKACNNRFGVVSMGVIEWIRRNLTDEGYHKSSYASVGTPIYLYLLRELSARHHLQHNIILLLLFKCFEMDVDLNPLEAV